MKKIVYLNMIRTLIGALILGFLAFACNPHGYRGAHRAKGHKVKKQIHKAKHAQKEIGHIQKSNLKHTEHQAQKKNEAINEANQNQHHESPNPKSRSSHNDGTFSFY